MIAMLMHSHLSTKYSLQIPRKAVIGYGLYIGHHMCVVINKTAVIGNNCNLSQFVTIGSNHGQAANIGDNVYIGPNTCIVEDVTIGNNVTIGAGSVVVKNIPDNFTAAGNPARLLSEKCPARYIENRWPIF
jgi:serine O-acetyltransferase